MSIVERGLRIHDLGRPFEEGHLPHSTSHPGYCHAVVRRHGDQIRCDGGSSSTDIIFTGLHVGTHIDAIAHVAQDGLLHGGILAANAMARGAYRDHGINVTPPLVGRGILLDVGRVVSGGRCAPAYEITPDDLALTARHHGVKVRAGDVVLVRTGWGELWDDGEAYLGVASGVPGVGPAAAQHLARSGVRAIGSDTSALEVLPANRVHGQTVLPVHRILLVEHGVNIIESLALEELAAAGVHDFLFVGAHLNLVGATGAPMRPLAILEK